MFSSLNRENNIRFYKREYLGDLKTLHTLIMESLGLRLSARKSIPLGVREAKEGMIDYYKRAKDLNPPRMNPLIANVLSKMGVVEELGSGPRRIFKYTPLIAGGKEPLIEEEDVYKVSCQNKLADLLFG